MKLAAAYYGLRQLTGFLGTQPLQLGLVRIYLSFARRIPTGDVASAAAVLLIPASSQHSGAMQAGVLPVDPGTFPATVYGSARLNDLMGAQAHDILTGGLASKAGDGRLDGTAKAPLTGAVLSFVSDASVLAMRQEIRLDSITARLLGDTAEAGASASVLAAAGEQTGRDVSVPTQADAVDAAAREKAYGDRAKAATGNANAAASPEKLFSDAAAGSSELTHAGIAKAAPVKDDLFPEKRDTRAAQRAARLWTATAAGGKSGDRAGTAADRGFGDTAETDCSPEKNGSAAERGFSDAAAGDSSQARNQSAPGRLISEAASGGSSTLISGSGPGRILNALAAADRQTAVFDDLAQSALMHSADGDILPNLDTSATGAAITGQAEAQTRPPHGGDVSGRSMDAAADARPQTLLPGGGTSRALDSAASPLTNEPVKEGSAEKSLSSAVSPLATEPKRGGVGDRGLQTAASPLTKYGTPDSASGRQAMGADIIRARPRLRPAASKQRAAEAGLDAYLIGQSPGIAAAGTGSDELRSGKLTMRQETVSDAACASAAAAEAEYPWAVVRGGWLVIRQAYGASVSGGMLTIE